MDASLCRRRLQLSVTRWTVCASETAPAGSRAAGGADDGGPDCAGADGAGVGEGAADDGTEELLPLERAIRIRTGETDHGAVTPVGA